MILTDELRGIIAKRGLSQREVAKRIGITEKTFYSKMKKGVFGSNEMERMIEVLKIEDAASIFFAHVGAQNAPKPCCYEHISPSATNY